MAERIKLRLTESQQTELEVMRDRHPKAYLRERAGALLKIAGGKSPHWVAQQGLLRPREPDTVYEWVSRYQAQGVAGLVMKAGRGRKPAFSPSASDRGGGPGSLAEGGAAGAAAVWLPAQPLDAGDALAAV